MPFVEPSQYRPPLLFRHAHLNTVYASLLRSLKPAPYRRQRITTADDDFLDLDWIETGSERLIVICHGLEGSTRSAYVQGMALAAAARGWDALAWNYRGCSGEPNRLRSSYHSGKTDDLAYVLEHSRGTGRYRSISLAGYSLGGNIVLKFLGEAPGNVPAEVMSAAAIGAPCDLACCADELGRLRNRPYLAAFLKTLKRKIELKAKLFPKEISVTGLEKLKDFWTFDDRYTAPLHNFGSVHEYYRRSSSRQFIPGIRVPTLLINPADDPFLGAGCFPLREAQGHEHLWLEIPRWGGHIGFMSGYSGKRTWAEDRVLDFLESHASSRVAPARR